ncbi:sugar ABC transporter ATP-binding protein [Rhodopirellula sallentina]|uniref:Sugar ABC superfamily ATP binding cassette transporter, ABC protein n=1 Tax=Rhodopirellula sallentina SM41 TaxID=1263870 RepID=M5U5W0_9BACT|nr:sugar ABC transporter ATP-binding protein [Rhodopirellula sallentina]EMI56847.1 sugar ABC superfamily ATP binding cassette transporter, ABC protein [Rhodopirellula sallentina SM41]
MSEPALLEINALQKSFPGVKALAGVDFRVRRGEVHALMGENGAGKSTLIKVLNGVHDRDSGEVRLDGQVIHPRAPTEAESLGISTVFQEVNLIPSLSVAENIALGRQPRRFGLVNWREVKRSARTAIERLGLSIDVDRELSSYSVATQQMIAIARAINLDAKLLVLDEPTSSLDEKEVEELFSVMERLRDQGLGIVFVTHFLDQVYRICDRITVLRNGQHVGEYVTADLPRIELIAKMLGKETADIESMEAATVAAHHQDAIADGNDTEQTAFVRAKQYGRRGAIEPFDFSIRKGEVVGLAGLLGSGRTEIARLLFGLDSPTEGTLEVDSEERTNWNPRRAIDAGIAFCPEDRKVEGVIAELSVRENIVLAMQASRSVLRTLPMKKQVALANHYIDALKIKTPSTETAVGTLSGGNQQKVLLARWLVMNPKLIILDEPTRGIDVGAKAEIETLVASLRREGMAVVFVSSELDEVVRTCQRVAVLRDQKVVGTLAGDDVNEQGIMEMIARSHD